MQATTMSAGSTGDCWRIDPFYEEEFIIPGYRDIDRQTSHGLLRKVGIGSFIVRPNSKDPKMLTMDVKVREATEKMVTSYLLQNENGLWIWRYGKENIKKEFICDLVKEVVKRQPLPYTLKAYTSQNI